MINFNPKQGEMILVWSNEDVQRPEVHEFLAKRDGVYFVVMEDGGVYGWDNAAALPSKPEPIPYTHETWPKQVVWVREKGGLTSRMVTSVKPGFINFAVGHYSFKTMFESYEMSLDFCQTWQPCHYVPWSE